MISRATDLYVLIVLLLPTSPCHQSEWSLTSFVTTSKGRSQVCSNSCPSMKRYFYKRTKVTLLPKESPTLPNHLILLNLTQNEAILLNLCQKCPNLTVNGPINNFRKNLSFIKMKALELRGDGGRRLPAGGRGLQWVSHLNRAALIICKLKLIILLQTL